VITKTQSRIVRDATLKDIHSRQEKAFEHCRGSVEGVTPSNIAKFLHQAMYRAANAAGVAAFAIERRVRGKRKKFSGYYGEWGVYEGRLFCAAAWTYFDGNEPQIEDFVLMDISRHALERVSERLNTLDRDEIRKEMAPVPASFCAELIVGEPAPGEYMARTANGIAIIQHHGDDIPIVTTWIDEDICNRSQLDGWLEITNESNKKIRTDIETASGGPVYALRLKT